MIDSYSMELFHAFGGRRDVYNINIAYIWTAISISISLKRYKTNISLDS